MDWINRIIKNIRKRGLKDVTNPDKVSAFLTAEDIKKNGIHLSYEEIIPYSEQLIYRAVVCNTCVNKGECTHCTCEVPSSLMVKKHECSGGNFFEMKTPEEWEEFKKLTGLKFEITSTNK